MEYQEAIRTALREDGQMYNAIMKAYLRDIAGGPATLDEHCHGMIAAVQAVYMLGRDEGFRHGAAYIRERAAKDERIENALKNFQESTYKAYDMIENNTAIYGQDAAKTENDAILARLDDERATVKNIMLEAMGKNDAFSQM